MGINVRKILLRNTLSSYAGLFLKMLTSIFMTKIIFQGLGSELYGFWALLWTIFGYSLLLDFGFGVSVQKYTAEARVSQDFKLYNGIIAAVVGSYILMSVIIIIGSLIFCYFFESIFTSVAQADVEYYRSVFLVFGLGIAVVFPSGVFSEILNGLHRSDLRTYILMVSNILNVMGTYLIFYLEYSVLALTVYTLSLQFVVNLVMYMTVKLIVPGFSVSIFNFKFKYIKEILSFSFYAYFFTMASMVIFRTDHIILSLMMNMSAVAIYHIGTRISFIIEKLTTQFQANLGPIVASLYKEGDYEKLQKILIKSNKIAAFLATWSFGLSILLAGPILFVWLGVEDALAIQVSQLMIFSVFITVLFRSSSFRFLQMAGMHKGLAYIVSCEAVVNVALSLFLVAKIGVLGVVYGTLLPNLLISMFVIFPMFSNFSKISILDYMRRVYFPILISSVPMIFYIYYYSRSISPDSWTFSELIYISFIASIIYLLTFFIICLSRKEKKIFVDFFMTKYNKIMNK